MSLEPEGSFATLTHARVRIDQGDVAGALRILRMILEVQPSHDEARRLLTEIKHRAATSHEEREEPAPEAVTAATTHGLSRRFREVLAGDPRKVRIDRLRSWLERTQRRRGQRRVR